MQEFVNVGKRVPKMDAEEKATGKAVYIHDLKVPGMLYGKILYSIHPHAKILRIDTSRAEKLLGVKAVLTGYNIPPIKFGFYKDNVPLKAGKVRSCRDEIAAVAAVESCRGRLFRSHIYIEWRIVFGYTLPDILDSLQLC